MVKKRRRSKYKTRPVEPKQPGARTVDDPSLQSQQVDDAAPVTGPAAPVAPATGIPSTGMPIAAALGQPLPTGTSESEDQGYAEGGAIEQTGHWGPKEQSSSSSSETDEEIGGFQNIAPPGGFPLGFGSSSRKSSKRSSSTGVQSWARGGSIPAPMPGYSDYTPVSSDPVARRRYSPRHVGFARGGEVDDPMGYVPDQPQEQLPPQRGGFDEFDVIGRKDPQVNPMLAGGTGYAKGGEVAVPVPAYTDPVYPAPNAANVKLYADMDAIRARTVNPPTLPAFNFPSAPAPGQQGPVPQRGTAVTPPVGPDDMPRLQRLGFAEGGAVPGAPDPSGYLNGDNAMDPQELDGVLQQIAQLDPNAGEDAVNLTAIVQAAQSGDMDRASSILAGFRRRFDSLNAHAQGAAAHGDLNAAAQLAGKAHSQVPDGMTINYAVAPDGSVTATVSPSGQTFQMSAQQFHDYLVGPGTSFDHILENGLEKNLAIASSGQGGQRAPGVNPVQQAPGANLVPTGYAEGGDVQADDSEVRRRSIAEAQARVEQQLDRSYGPGGSRERGDMLYSGPGSPYDPTGSKTRYQELERANARPESQRPDVASRQTVKDTLDHTRRQYGLADDNPENAAPYQVAGDWMPPPVGGRTALEAGIGAPEQPAGGRTALSRGVGYEGPAGGRTAGGGFLQQLKSGLGFGGDEATVSAPSQRATTVAEPTAPSEPRMGVRPVPGPASARRGVEYPEPLPGEGLGGSTVSARRVGTPAAAAAPEPQRLGSREDISLPPAAQPTAAAPAPVNPRQAAYDAAYKAAADRGDIYTTPRWSMDRLTKEGIPDIMQGKLFGRKNVVDYPKFPEDEQRTLPSQTRAARGPVDVEERRRQAVEGDRRYQRDLSDTEKKPRPELGESESRPPLPSAQRQAGQPAAVEPHEQRMREIDAQQQQLRQPIAPAGSGVTAPREWEGRRGVDRYNKEIVADQHRYANEVNQRNATITDQRHQDDVVIKTYNYAREHGTDTPELKRAYEASMYRTTGGKLAIPREEAPATKKEEPGIMQRIFGGGAPAKPAAQATYGSPGWPPRAPSPGKRWGLDDATGKFVEY